MSLLPFISRTSPEVQLDGTGKLRRVAEGFPQLYIAYTQVNAIANVLINYLKSLIFIQLRITQIIICC